MDLIEKIIKNKEYQNLRPDEKILRDVAINLNNKNISSKDKKAMLEMLRSRIETYYITEDKEAVVNKGDYIVTNAFLGVYLSKVQNFKTENVITEYLNNIHIEDYDHEYISLLIGSSSHSKDTGYISSLKKFNNILISYSNEEILGLSLVKKR